jgi:hypothetical protein
MVRPVVRLSDAAALRAHAARFPPEAIPREGLSPLDACRLDSLLVRPYEELTAEEVALALSLGERARLPSLFAWVLPAALRRTPSNDLASSDRLLDGLFRARGEVALAPWEPEIERALERLLEARSLRGGEDPVDLWVTDDALRLRALDAARRAPDLRGRRRVVPSWASAREGPFYARLALVLLDRYPARAEERIAQWEGSPDVNLSRAWVEVVFHANAMGWAPQAPRAFEALVSPERAARAHALLQHDALDVAVAAAAILRMVAPARAAGVRDRVDGLLAALDAAESDRFVLTSSVRRLLEAPD